MSKTRYKNNIVPVLLLLIIGCGSDYSANNSTDSGLLSVEIENAFQSIDINSIEANNKETFRALLYENDSNSILSVKSIKATITGQGIDSPIVGETDINEKQIKILEIPAGIDRTLLIEAFNKNGDVLKRRKIENLTILGGIVTAIKTRLNTIPIILNFKDGAVVLSNYFRIYGYGEPGTKLVVHSSIISGDAKLNENKSVIEVVITPSITTGTFELKPPNFSTGSQTITLTDENTSETSSKTITIIDSEDRPGTRTQPFGAKNTFLAASNGFGETKAVNFPQLLKQISKQTATETPK